MNDSFGLLPSDITAIGEVLEQQTAVESALIFGSRAKGNYRKGSDVDIALKGKDLNYKIINDIAFYLNEETLMPYRFDVLNYHTLGSADLKDHIDRVGVAFYCKEKEQPITGELIL